MHRQIRVLLHIQLNCWLENVNYTLLVVISCRHLGAIEFEACEIARVMPGSHFRQNWDKFVLIPKKYHIPVNS